MHNYVWCPHLQVSPSPPAQSAWSYFSWAQGLVPWGPAKDDTLASGNEIHPQMNETKLEQSMIETTNQVDEESLRREAFVQACLSHYRAHSEECAQRLPLVGVQKDKERLLKHFLDTIEETATKKALDFLTKHKLFSASEKVLGLDGSTEETCSSSVSDLACINADLDIRRHSATPTLYHSATPTLDPLTTPTLLSGNWVGYYMQVELAEEEEAGPADQTTPTNQSANMKIGLLDPHERHTMLVKALRPLIDGIKILVMSSQEYLKDEFVFAEMFSADEQLMMPVGRIMVEMVAMAKVRWSEAVERYVGGAQAIKCRNGDGRSRDSGHSMDFEPDVILDSKGSAPSVASKVSSQDLRPHEVGGALTTRNSVVEATGNTG